MEKEGGMSQMSGKRRVGKREIGVGRRRGEIGWEGKGVRGAGLDIYSHTR